VIRQPELVNQNARLAEVRVHPRATDEAMAVGDAEQVRPEDVNAHRAERRRPPIISAVLHISKGSRIYASAQAEAQLARCLTAIIGRLAEPYRIRDRTDVSSG
jgi:hypothetical protein